MYRIDNTSAVPSMPAPGPPGTPGWFTDGNPAAALEATIVDAWWCNILQEEILTVVQNAGITPNKASHTQLWEALESLYQRGGALGGYLPLTGGTLYAGPGIATPFRVHSIGMPAGVELHNVGVQNWWIGVLNDGPFVIYDATATTIRLSINGGGAVSCQQNLWVGGNATIVGDLSALNLAANNVTASHNMSAVNAIWQGTATPTGNAISAVDLMAAGNTSLRYTDCSGHDPLRINADGATNQYARIAYHVSGATLWQAGADPLGVFTIIDATSGTGALRFWIDPAGAVGVGHLTASGGVTVAGGMLLDALNVSGNSNFQSQLQVFGGLNVSGGLAADAIVSHALITATGGANVSGGFSADAAAIGTLGVSGVITATGGANVAGGFSADAAAVGTLGVSGVITANGGANFSGGMTVDNLTVTGVFTPPPSDVRLKKDIARYPRGLDAVCALRPVTFRFNGLGNRKDDGKTYHGLVAQEVIDIMPEMVGWQNMKLRPDDEEEQPVGTLDATALTYALVNAVQELTTRLEALERRN